jgi:hypothetical protein
MSSPISNGMISPNELTKVICSSGCHWFKWFSCSYSKSSAPLLLPSSSSIMLCRITHAIIMSLSVSSFQNCASPRLQIVLYVLQTPAPHLSLLTLGLQQSVFSYSLVEMKLFSQMLPTVDICHQ